MAKVRLQLQRATFQPIRELVEKRPINVKVHRFLWSEAPVHYKLSMLACEFLILCLLLQSIRRLTSFSTFNDRYILIL